MTRLQDTLVHQRPPQRRLERIHQKTNVKRNKVNRTKNNEILLYELGEAFRHIFKGGLAAYRAKESACK